MLSQHMSQTITVHKPFTACDIQRPGSAKKKHIVSGNDDTSLTLRLLVSDTNLILRLLVSAMNACCAGVLVLLSSAVKS